MRFIAFLAGVIAGIATLNGPAAARDRIWVVGSSTVQPFTKAVAESVARAAGTPDPVVENTGTTPGFWAFCGGVGPSHPDATNATRRMKKSEFKACQENGVSEVVEIIIGLDILAVAQSTAGPAMTLTPTQLFLAIAAQVPDKDGGLVANPYQSWSDIDSSLPNTSIDVRVLPPISGTRDALQELFLQRGAENIAELAELSSKEKLRLAKNLRTDGQFVVLHEDQNVIAHGLVANPNAIGIFGYRFLEENRAALRGIPIDGTDPTAEHAYSGKYKGTRKLYLYIKKAHLNIIPGLSMLPAEYVSRAALGPDGFLLALGFVPLSIVDMLDTMVRIHAMTPLRGDSLPD